MQGYLRFNRYGNWQSTGGQLEANGNDTSNATRYGGEILTDIEARFTFAENYIVAVGGKNISTWRRMKKAMALCNSSACARR
ncbi:hypothetical protein [Microbulbifer sp. ARAS458-1]|uniref:hypothetical protein n=1 Tax=Microbulbifer sp. ARAS458-1 TaxID=3140242 RepID=UPI00387829ED